VSTAQSDGRPEKRTEVLALIPARSGSRAIPDKNIRLFRGLPLLAHSIRQARAAQTITRTIVSTDSVRYADIARRFGADVPFLRPAAIAGDLSTDLEVFQHALDWLRREEDYLPDICVHLRPTYPVRRVADIDAIVAVLLQTPALDAVRSVAVAPHTPFKMWFRDESGLLKPVVQGHLRDAHSLPRQQLPTVYLQNACIDAVRPQVVLGQGSMTGEHVFGYVMDGYEDIDSEADFERLHAREEPAENGTRGERADS
jgi:CMP-N-acetylneuraminic acid synthetase